VDNLQNKFSSLIKKHWPLVITLIFVGIVSFLRYQKGVFQQDNYLDYAKTLPTRLVGLSYYDSRLFPGLPILILIGKFFTGNFLLAGYLIVILAFLGSYIILYRLTKTPYCVLALIFPPVMLNQATIIASEYLTILFLLLGIYVLKEKHYRLFFALCGFSFWFRPIGAAPVLGAAFYFYKKSELKLFLPNFIFLLPGVILFFLYNAGLFGLNDIFHPFVAYTAKASLQPTFPLIQLFKDIPEAFRPGSYRIFFSGLTYLFLFITLLLSARGTSLVFAIALALTIYVFSFGYNPFLSNLGRYLVPIFPLLWLVLRKKMLFSEKPLFVTLLLFISGVAVVI